MGPQRRLRMYVGFDSSSIIRYLEPLTGDVCIAHSADFHFNECIPTIRGGGGGGGGGGSRFQNNDEKLLGMHL